MTAARTTSAEEVAEVLFDAATYGTNQLRYLVGDSRGFIKAGQEMSDEDYVAFLRSHFLPKL